MTDETRVAVLIDWQNAYMAARNAFWPRDSPNEFGNFSPFRLASWITRQRGRQGSGKLCRVEVHRGQPDASRDSIGYSANRRQAAAWENEAPDLVFPRLRPLRYPYGWPDVKPEEKGVDVQLALSAVELTMSGACDVVVIVSSDSDLAPVAETVARLAGPGAIETAQWNSESFVQRIRPIPGVWNHYLHRTTFGVTEDRTNYAVSRSASR